MTAEPRQDERRVDLHVPTLSRVEGEGALHVAVDGGEITDLRLEIYEPPRFFEAFLRGRGYLEPVDITARICGICPVAYQMSAIQSLERTIGVDPSPLVRDLRRLVYCGEWIESHVLHIGLLHAPDFLGVPSGLDLATTHRDLVEMVLELKKVGNDVLEVVAGRPIHPVNLTLGGFHRFPRAVELHELDERLTWARGAAVDLVRWTATFDFPDITTDHELVSLSHPDEYAICAGRLVSDRGLDVTIDDFDDEFVEIQRAHSTALHSLRRDGRPYLTGPLARWANNREVLPDTVTSLAEEVGVAGVVRNPFRSILVRALEVLYAVEEAQRIIASYVEPTLLHGHPVPPPRAGASWGASEAPRGVLLHRYELDGAGTILDARIVPPTAQNQAAIEADVHAVVVDAIGRGWLDEAADGDALDRLRHRSEMAIRNHDPCISCATHFLEVDIRRESGAPMTGMDG